MEGPYSYMPRYLDEKERLFFWTLDECFILMSVILIGVFCNYLITGLFLAFACQFLYSKLKNTLQLSVLSQYCYWIFPRALFHFLKTAPDMAIREYVG